MSEMIDAKPGTGMLHSLHRNGMSMKQILAEFLDNSFDAGADKVTIAFHSDSLSVADDGRGISDFGTLWKLGEHVADDDMDRMGKYGIGLKDAAGRLWGITEVVSVRDGMKTSQVINWEQWANSREWKIPKPQIGTAPPGAVGTKILCKHVDYKLPRGDRLDELIDDIAFLYTPALASGRQVIVHGPGRRRPLRPIPWPIVEHRIDEHLFVEGQAVHLEAGVVVSGTPNPQFGLHCVHMHRIIELRSSYGCAGENTTRIFGFITLEGPEWCLTKHKNAVAEYRDELDEAIIPYMKPLLDYARTQTDLVRVDELAQLLTDDLSSIIRGQEHRRPTIQEGATQTNGENTGSRETATEIHDNDARQLIQKRSPALRIQFAPLPKKDGICITGRREITLNESHPWINAMMRASSDEAIDALRALALAAYTEMKGRQPKLCFDEEESVESFFSSKMAMYLDDVQARSVIDVKKK